MAEKKFNRGGLDSGLAEYLGLKGRLQATIDSEMQPVIVVSDLSAGPYARDYTPAAGVVQSAPSALQFGYVGVRPSVGTAIQITRCEILSLEIAPGHLCRLKFIQGGAVNAIAAAGATSLTASTRLLQELTEVTNAPTVRGAQMVDLLSTVNNGDAEFWKGNVSNLTPTVIDFPDPGVLIVRRSAANLGGLFYQGGALDVDAIVTFYWREWPLPG